MKNYKSDTRIILTLDAGGTNFVFSAMRGGEEIVSPTHLPAETTDAGRCVECLVSGFKSVMESLSEAPVAISFAFPGPADYKQGIIGDLPNFPCFRGGFPLGPILEAEFGIPVFINNDGNLFAYGEALAGTLPEVNTRLELMGSSKRFHNLIGVTLGTGFGCGVVVDGTLLIGDNSSGGDIWCFRNKKYTRMIVEESVSIRAVKRVYAELSDDKTALTPKDIFDIAEGVRPGNMTAAREAFAELGEIAGDALSEAITLIDGLVVIGGGLSGADKYIVPAMVREMNNRLYAFSGECFPRLQVEVYNLDDATMWPEFARGREAVLHYADGTRRVTYDALKRTGVITTSRETRQSIALGAYVYALSHLD